MSREKPACTSGRTWLAKLKGRSALAPLTGQDASALNAFLHLVELYARADDNGRQRALAAMRETVLAMQPSTRWLAKTAIPSVLDWGDEERIWGALFDAREEGSIDRDAVEELTELLRKAGLTPYLHTIGCATWKGGPCDKGCRPNATTDSGDPALAAPPGLCPRHEEKVTAMSNSRLCGCPLEDSRTNGASR